MDGAPEGRLGGAQLGPPADVGQPGVVGRAQGVAEPPGVLQDGAAGAAGHGHRLGAVLLADLEQAGGDAVEGLVPGDPLPAARAPGAGAAEGVQQAVGMILQLGGGQAFGAEGAPGGGGGRVALHLDHLAVPHVHQHPAAGVAHHAGGGDDLDHVVLAQRCTPDRDTPDIVHP